MGDDPSPDMTVAAQLSRPTSAALSAADVVDVQAKHLIWFVFTFFWLLTHMMIDNATDGLTTIPYILYIFHYMISYIDIWVQFFFMVGQWIR